MAESLTKIDRFASACSFSLVTMQVSREMFGKSYFALGAEERTAVNNATVTLVVGSFQILTPERLIEFEGIPKASGPVGFAPPAGPTNAPTQASPGQ